MRPQQPARAHCCTVRRTASSASPASKSPRATPLASCAQRSDSIVIQPAADHTRRLPPGRSAARPTAARKAESRGFRFAFAGESAGAARRASMRRVPHRHDGDGRHAPRRRQRAWEPIRRHGKGRGQERPARFPVPHGGSLRRRQWANGAGRARAGGQVLAHAAGRRPAIHVVARREAGARRPPRQRGDRPPRARSVPDAGVRNRGRL